MEDCALSPLKGELVPSLLDTLYQSFLISSEFSGMVYIILGLIPNTINVEPLLHAVNWTLGLLPQIQKQDVRYSGIMMEGWAGGMNQVNSLSLRAS